MAYEKNDYWDRERECERLFAATRPFYFITTENLDWTMYETLEEFIMGTNLIAIASARSGFVILDDVQMNNHHHVMGKGTYDKACCFFEILHDGERYYQRSLGRPSLKKWDIRIDETADLKAFRSRVAYTDRNAYVARLDSMPTGYPWGSASLFFNGNLRLMNPGIPFEKVGGREKRIICRSHDTDLPSHYRVCDGMILRSSFVDYHATEDLFNSANQYFTLLTRRGEADVEIAAMLGEKIQLPTEEVFQIVSSWFQGQNIRTLEPEARLNAAKMMKQRLASSNRQITHVLRLPAADVERMFPKAE